MAPYNQERRKGGGGGVGGVGGGGSGGVGGSDDPLLSRNNSFYISYIKWQGRDQCKNNLFKK